MALSGINPRGDLVGWYRPVTAGLPTSGSSWTSRAPTPRLEIPDAWETIPYGINASGVLVGTAYYWTIGTPYNDNYVDTHGFIGKPVRGGGK
jgi:hypothetical protein